MEGRREREDGPYHSEDPRDELPEPRNRLRLRPLLRLRKRTFLKDLLDCWLEMRMLLISSPWLRFVILDGRDVDSMVGGGWIRSLERKQPERQQPNDEW